MKKSVRIKPPEVSFRTQVLGWCVYVCIVIFTLWQGSYFPIQFLLILTLFFVAFIFFGKSISISIEVAFLFGIFLLYAVSFFFQTENHYIGLIELLRIFIFPLSLIFFLNYSRDTVERAFSFSIMFVAVLGLLAFFSIIYIPEGVIRSSNRLQSVIQYANTTALLMLVGILYFVSSFIKEKKFTKLVCCVILTATFFLTGSRTTLVVALVTCTLFALVISKKRGRLIISGSAILLICLFICLSIFTDIRMFRISLFEPTLVERWISFEDAFSMMRGNWLLGIGMGNWQEWQFLYQSAPYQVKFIHNFYLQMLLDGGFLAPLLFLAATVPAIIKGIRLKSVHAFILIAVLLQAVLDFDLIFSAVAMISMFSLSHLSLKTTVISIGKFRFIAIAPLLAVSVLWFSEFLSSSANAHLVAGNLDDSMSRNNLSLRLNPLNTGLYYQMAQSTRDTDLTEQLLRTGIEKSPRNIRAISILVLIEAEKGNFLSALELCERLIENRKHSSQYHSLYLDIATQALEDGAIGDDELDEIQARLNSIVNNENPLYKQFMNVNND